MNPIVSVVMPAYNAAPYLQLAIESILRQSFSDLELIIVDDGSSDETYGIALNIASRDSRIRLVKNDCNLGLASTMNRAIAMAQGAFVARMDADDLSHLDRIQMQVDFLSKNQDIGLVGTWMRSFGESQYLKKYPVSVEECKAKLLFGVPVGHPSVMFRRSLWEEHGLAYCEELKTYGEDYDLWCRFSKVTRICNLPKVYIDYRTFPKKTKSDIVRMRRLMAMGIRERVLLDEFAVDASEREIAIHHSLSDVISESDVSLTEIKQWCVRLEEHNSSFGFCNEEAFKAILDGQLSSWIYHRPSFLYMKDLAIASNLDWRLMSKFTLNSISALL